MTVWVCSKQGEIAVFKRVFAIEYHDGVLELEFQDHEPPVSIPLGGRCFSVEF